MAQQLIDLAGQSVDSVRTAFSKINDNFTEIFVRCGPTATGIYANTVNDAAQIINLGEGPEMTGGDTISQAFLKIVANFDILYAAIPGTYQTIVLGSDPFSDAAVSVALERVNNNFTDLYTILGLTVATPEVEDPEYASYTPTIYNFDRGYLVTSSNTTTDSSFVDPYSQGLELIDLGTGPDTYTGDTLYVAFTKVNHNFIELYDVFGPNGGTNLQGNTITANYFVTTGNVRAGNVIAYGNIETIGNSIASGFFYPNGLSIVDQISSNINLSAISSNIIPTVDGIFNLGSSTSRFNQLYLSDSFILTGAIVTTDGTQFLINGAPAASSYTNNNVANYLPIYGGNLGAVNNVIANRITVNTDLSVSGPITTTSLQVNTTAIIDGDLSVGGNLRVEGNVTYFNVETFTVEDPIITLNTGANGSPLTANVNFDSGVQSYYYDGENRAAFFGRKNDTGYFEYYSNVVAETGNIVSGELGTIRTGNIILTNDADIVGNVTAGTFYGNLVGNITGNLSVTGENTQVLYNNNGQVGAGSGLTFDSTANLLAVGGNISAANVAVTGRVTVIGNIFAAIVNAAGAVLDSLVLKSGLQDTPIGNTIPNTGAFTTLTANVLTANSATLGDLNSNSVTTGTVTVSGPSYLGNVGNVNITGGGADQYLSTDGTGNLSWRSFANSSITVDQFTANGSQTEFPLSVTPTNSNYVLVNVNGVVQIHSTYSILGNILVLPGAPPSGILIEAVIFTLASGGTVTTSASKNVAFSMLLG